MKPKTIFQWALINLVITAVIGLVLRLQPLGLIPGLHYKNWLHTHSHFAFLGWVYPALIACVADNFNLRADSKVQRLFWAMQILVLALLVTFPQYGYGWPTITVLSLHMVVTIWLVFYLIGKAPSGQRTATLFLRAGAWFLVVSGLGALALGPISAAGLKFSPYYFSSIYLYLHFQYNGWFTLALLGIIIARFRVSGLDPDGDGRLRMGLWILITGIVLTYLLSVLGFKVPAGVYVLAGAGALLQLVAFYLAGAALLKEAGWKERKYPATALALFWMACTGLCIKLLMQLLSALPAVVDFAYKSRDLIIAYLHEYLIGTVTLALLALAIGRKWVRTDLLFVRFGVWFFVGGFLLTEMALGIRGTGMFEAPIVVQYALLIGAGCMVCGMLCTWVGTLSRRN